MNELRCTLLSDGSSDASLLPILNWLLVENGVTLPIQSEWADLSRHVGSSKPSLSDKIRVGLKFYPCDLLFVHRDAETENRAKRVAEIESALSAADAETQPVVCVVPVRMMEAWLLFDEVAIKQAAETSRYRGDLDLPDLNRLEDLANPKETLHVLLKQASGLNNRRLRRFPVQARIRRVAEYLTDFSPLRQLNAFRSLETDIQSLVSIKRWDRGE